MLISSITKKLFLTSLLVTGCIPSTVSAHTIKHAVDHIFQRNQPNVSPQILDKSCFVATIMMALKYAIKQKKINYHMPTYAQLCAELQTNPKDGTSLEAIMDFLEYDNWSYRIITDRMSDIVECLNDGPIGVIIKNSNSPRDRNSNSNNNVGHAVLLTEKNESGFTFLDPWHPKNSPDHKQFISFDEFKRNWNPKVAIQII